MTRKNHSLFVYLIVMLIGLCSLLVGVTPQIFASAEGYSNVLDDLQRDESFDASAYPIKENDHSLQVVTIAESEKGELFVYVYQPSASHKATSISFSTQKKDKEFRLYYLNYANKFKALYKYVVQDFEVASDETRYYEIASIFRLWNSDIDKEPAPGQTISEVSFAVGKQYILTDEETICFDVETIEITDKYVGYVQYRGSANIWNGAKEYVDSHFVAFSTDKKIESLLEADVYFQTQIKEYQGYGAYAYGDIQDNYCLIGPNNMTASFASYSGWEKSSFAWQRISSKDDFVASEDFKKSYNCGIFNISAEYKLSDECKESISACEWVLRFYESSYETWYDSTASTLTPVQYNRSVIVSNVSLLRLQFETAGRVYNLGVVDNKQSGDSKPDNQASIRVALNWSLFSLLLLAIFAILLLIFAPHILILIIKLAWKAIKAICKGLWWVFTSPLILFEKEEKQNG